MGTSVKLQMNSTQRILLKRSLNQGGGAQKFFSSEMKRIMDPYVPFLTGTLKNTATVVSTGVQYDTPYARRQYYENKGKGLRGSLWDKRAWADNGNQVVESVAKYVGGKAK